MVPMSSTNPATFLIHEADGIAAKDARLKLPQILRAAAKHYTDGVIPSGITYTEITDACEEQIEWAHDTHRPATAAVYQRVLNDLTPHREEA